MQGPMHEARTLSRPSRVQSLESESCPLLDLFRRIHSICSMWTTFSCIKAFGLDLDDAADRYVRLFRFLTRGKEKRFWKRVSARLVKGAGQH